MSTQNSEENSEQARGSRRGQNLAPWRWKPGQSGNPGGRPKKKPITDAYNELMALIDPKSGLTGAQLLARAAMERALREANPTLIKEITDRVEGAVKQSLDVLFSEMSNEDLEQYIAQEFGTASAADGGSTPEGDQSGSSDSESEGGASDPDDRARRDMDTDSEQPPGGGI